ncbi:MAG: hypothetical protein NZ518_10510 [Dehalococcoidia bacterium]|nr:hypothetical protein [Dehalococcoidia bacterium]
MIGVQRAAPSWREPNASLRWAFATNGPLAFTGVVVFAVLVVSVVGLVVDPTVVTGAPA